VVESGLFIGWGSPHPGKEIASVKVFEEAVAYWGALQTAGEIESVEYAILGYHGGDLRGFALLRGDPEKLGRLSMSPEFHHLTMRAAACLENVGVVSATLDAGVTSRLGQWKEVIADLT
jgi:hypothetical protein